MKIITLISPDKLTKSMFTDFYRAKNPNKVVIVLDINILFSLDMQEKIVNDCIKYVQDNGKENSTDIIVKYKVKNKPDTTINSSIEEISDYILKFDIFSTHPEIVKESDPNYAAELIKDWEESIEKLNS